MAKWIYKLKITLIDSKPLIWRRILVEEDVLLSDLHKIIQSAMGWTNSHLHQFIKDLTYYTGRIPGDDLWDEVNNVNYIGIKLTEILRFGMMSIPCILLYHLSTTQNRDSGLI